MLKKYKYYFKKSRVEIAKDILEKMLIAGTICVAATSPFFIQNLLNANKKWRKYPRKKIQDTFYNFKRRGLIEIERKNHQIYIHLTKEGEKRAGWMQINALKIIKPSKWDRKWRLVIFDIAQLKRTYRDAFRGKIKELGFFPLQKSVWIYPFDCEAEIKLLREFFGLSENEIRIIIAEKIGDDSKLKRVFKLV